MAAPIARNARTRRQNADRQGRHGFEEADEEEDGGRQHIRRVVDVRRELQRPGRGQEPSPDQPARERRLVGGRYRQASAQSAANESTLRKTNGASGMGAIRSGTPTSSGCSAPAICALCPDDVRAEVRPLARGVVPQPHQVDLRLVFRPEFGRQAEGQTAEEERGSAAIQPARGNDRRSWISDLRLSIVP